MTICLSSSLVYPSPGLPLTGCNYCPANPTVTNSCFVFCKFFLNLTIFTFLYRVITFFFMWLNVAPIMFGLNVSTDIVRFIICVALYVIGNWTTYKTSNILNSENHFNGYVLHMRRVNTRVAAARGTDSGAGGVFTRAAPLSLPLKWVSTSSNSAAQCCREPTLYVLFFQAAQARWPIRAAILFTSVRFPLPVFRSRTNLEERQFWICVVGCRLPDAEEHMQDRHSAAGSPEADAHLTAILSGFKQQPGGCCSSKLHFRARSPGHWIVKSELWSHDCRYDNNKRGNY